MANKEFTFADQAKKIQKKYPRRKTDPIEKRDYMQEMENLAAEQEEARNSMGLNENENTEQQEFALGGPDNPTGNIDINSLLNYNPLAGFQYNMNDRSMGLLPSDLAKMSSEYNTPTTNLSTQTPTNISSDFSRNLNIPSELASKPFTRIEQSDNLALPNTLQKSNMFVGPGTQDYSGNNQEGDSLTPYLISGLSNIGSNLLLANMSSRNRPTISPTYASPKMINLEPQAQQLRKDATTARNIAMRNARNLGLSAPAAMANISAANTGVETGLGKNLTNLYLGQETANTQAANQFALANARAKQASDVLNTQLSDKYLQDKLGYLGSALGTIPGVMKDIRADKADKSMRDIQEAYYKSIGGQHYATEGSLFKAPDGFTYRVKKDKTLERI